MSEINRYRINPVKFINGKGWVKVTNNSRVGAIDQLHKKGGWCKWSDVKTQLAEKDAEIKEAMDMLDNVSYWEGCPDDYKERIEKLTEAKQ